MPTVLRGRRPLPPSCALAVLAALALTAHATAQPAPTAPNEPATTPDPPGLKRLSPQYDVWLDPRQKQVVMRGEVCLRAGALELFACLKHTKEHESIVAVETEAYIVHAALLALGAEPGNPAEFFPEYRPARGTQIDVFVRWKDEQGKQHEVPAQQWIRDVKTGRPMEHKWVFGGSKFWQDRETGRRHYMAEEGDFICVSNFTSAMLDLPVESSQSDAALLFEAHTEHIPPRGTEVFLILKPKLPAGGAKHDPATDK